MDRGRGVGGTYLGLGGGGTYLEPGGGVHTLDGGRGSYLDRGYLPCMGEGVPTLDRLCCGRYTSCGKPQEDFIVDSALTLTLGVNGP